MVLVSIPFLGAIGCLTEKRKLRFRTPKSFSRERVFEAVDFGAEVGGAFGDGEVEEKENAPANQIGGKDAVEIFHWASASRCRTSTSDRNFSRMNRSIIRKAARKCAASTEKKNTFLMVGSRPEPGPPMMTGAGCWVRHQRMAPNTMGTSRKAKMPKRALRSARRSGSSMSERSSK